MTVLPPPAAPARTSIARAACLALGALAAAGCIAAPAAPVVPAAPTSASPIIDLLHASWTARDGAPSGITSIAQTRDGWLWIGSTSGLYKFDGVRFLRASGPEAPLSSNISAIGVLPDGLLWVGYYYGGVSLMVDGHMRHYRPDEPDAPSGNVRAAARDGTGRLWLATGRGLHVLDAQGRWHRPAPSLGTPPGSIQALLADGRGTLWVRGGGIFALPKGAARFERRAPLTEFGVLGVHPDGSVWAADDARPGLYPLAQPAHGAALTWRLPRGLKQFMFDQEGNVWAGDMNGVLRAAAGPDAPNQRLLDEQGLSGRKVQAMYEDREHNIWIGTEGGLDRFRAPRLRATPVPDLADSNARPLAGGPGASVWADHVLLAGPHGSAHAFGHEPNPDDDFITALYRGPDGRVWAGGFGGLWAVRTDGSGWERLHANAETKATIYTMAQDRAGTLWMARGRRGVAAWRAGRWVAGGGVPELASFAAATVATDAQGRVWFGSVGDRLLMLDGGRLKHYGRADGLAVGTVVQILPAGAGVWVGGENGLMYFDGTRFTPVTGRGGEPFAGITGLVFGRDGTLWINGGSGISSIAPAELRPALTVAGYRVRFGRFDYRDGIRGTASALLPVPSATRSDDGTLWFSTIGGVYGFDPAALPRNALAPPVVITALRSGSAAFAASHGARLPAGTQTLDIDFTALSYREPERVLFRYRLNGVDGDWRENGERSAHYTNLGPGHYQFQVLAANDDGVWNTDGATLSFDIEPRLTQTLWFRCLCAAAMAVLVWRLQLFWLRRKTRQLELRMGERIAERERIARELHDTLLQSIQGLMLLFWGTVKRLGPSDRPLLESALARANTVMAEGRDRVAGLRTAVVPDADLAGVLRHFAEPLAHAGGVAFDLHLEGAPRRLRQAAADEIFTIVREALWNAFAHAHAHTIRVTLHYPGPALVVTVADDGVGMPADVDPTQGRAHHWGLTGMRERAHTLGATLTLVSPPGTVWTLRVPAAIAFE